MEIMQVNDYYPFGLTYNSYQRKNSLDQKYLYNGKELQDEFNLGWLDYGARMYMSDIGKWGAVDGLAENSITMSPYHYAANNPIVFVDIDGLDWFYYKKDGEEDASWNWHDGSEYKHTYSYKNEDGEEVTESITLQGTEAVVVFDGFTREELGTKAGHKAGSSNKSNQYMDGAGWGETGLQCS